MAIPARTVKTEHTGGSLVSIGEVRDHLSLFGDTTFDDYLNRIMIVATDHIGDSIGEPLDAQSITDYYRSFDRRIWLSQRSLSGTPVVNYTDADNTAQVLSSSEYIIDQSLDNPAIVITGNAPSSISRDIGNPINITYSVVNDLLVDQESIKQSILLIIGDMFKHRENDVDAALTRNTVTTERLLRPHRSNLI